MTEKELDLPYIAIIPYHVQTCETLSDAAKLYYGQIVGLSKKTGYLWASDEQLAQMKNTSVRNIQRWNKELEEAGFVYRETKNYPTKKDDGSFAWEKRRKIWVNESFKRLHPEPQNPEENAENQDSNNSCGTAKNGDSIGTAKNGESIEPAKNGGINKASSKSAYKKKQFSTPFAPLQSIVIPSSLDKLDLEQTLRVKISNDYEIEEIDKAVERCLRWNSRPSDAVGIMTTLSRADTWQDNPTPEEIEEKNTEHLKKLKKYDGKQLAFTQIYIMNNYIEFVAGMSVINISVKEKDFKIKVTEQIEYLEQLHETYKKQGHIKE